MTLQLPSLLDASSDKHVVFEIMALVEKTSQTQWETEEETVCDQLVKKSPKFDEKTRIENQRLD